METPREITNGFPEQEKPLGVLAVPSVLEAFRTFEGARNDENLEDLHTHLYSIQAVLRRGFSSGLIDDYTALRRLDFGCMQGASTFWDTHREAITTLTEELHAAYIEDVAGEVAFTTGFLLDNPSLVRIGSPEGPFITGIDADFSQSGRPAEVVLYANGEPFDQPVEATTQAFLELRALPADYHAAMARYRCEHGV